MFSELVNLVRHFLHQFDMQHPVDMGRAGDADMIGQMEPTLERAGGDAAMQIGLLLFGLGLAGGHDKRAVLHLDVEVSLGKPRDGYRNPVSVLVGLFDVVGGIGRLGHIGGQNPIHQVGHPVETDSGTVKRGKIVTTHIHPPKSDASGGDFHMRTAANPCSPDPSLASDEA